MGAADEQQVIEALQAGLPAIFPTDTVYGLGVAVGPAKDPAQLYQLKQRDADKPIAWLIGSIDDLAKYGKGTDRQTQQLAQKGWPGPLTLVVRASDKVPQAFCSPQGTIGLRMPANPTTLALIQQVGCPLATTSANLAGSTAPAAAAKIDPALLRQVPALLQDPKDTQGRPSRVIDCTQPNHVVLRD